MFSLHHFGLSCLPVVRLALDTHDSLYSKLEASRLKGLARLRLTGGSRPTIGAALVRINAPEPPSGVTSTSAAVDDDSGLPLSFAFQTQFSMSLFRNQYFHRVMAGLCIALLCLLIISEPAIGIVSNELTAIAVSIVFLVGLLVILNLLIPLLETGYLAQRLVWSFDFAYLWLWNAIWFTTSLSQTLHESNDNALMLVWIYRRGVLLNLWNTRPTWCFRFYVPMFMLLTFSDSSS